MDVNSCPDGNTTSSTEAAASEDTSVLRVPSKSSTNLSTICPPSTESSQQPIIQSDNWMSHGDSRRISSKRVTFGDIEIFYFDRSQGFICVPSQGGSTLGMGPAHSGHEGFSVADHQKIRQIQRYFVLLKKFKNGSIILTPQQSRYIIRRLKNAPKPLLDRVFHDIPLKSPNAGSVMLDNGGLRVRSLDNPIKATNKRPNLDNDRMHSNSLYSSWEDPSMIDKEIEGQLSGIVDNYFLQLLPVRKRRLLLRKSGLQSIDHVERIECQSIRISRENCGCSCTASVCLPDACECALNGIKCQVDRALFPCSCTQATMCHNPHGRIEFDPMRVRAHYLHTRMRLDLEAVPSSSPRGLGSNDSHGVQWVHESNEEPCEKKARLLVGDSMLSDPNLQSVPAGSSSPCDSCAKPTTTLASCSTPDDPTLSKYNTTLYGACRDCQDKNYVHRLIQQLHACDTEVECAQTVPAAPFPNSFTSAVDNYSSDEGLSPQSTESFPQRASTDCVSGHTDPSTQQLDDTVMSIQSRSVCALTTANFAEIPCSNSEFHTSLQSAYPVCTSVATAYITSASPTDPGSVFNEEMSGGHCALEPISSLFAQCVSSAYCQRMDASVRQQAMYMSHTSDSSVVDCSLASHTDSRLHDVLLPIHVCDSSDSVLPSADASPDSSSPRSTSPYVESVSA